MALKGEHVTCVALGSGDSQTVCSTASSLVFSWGDGDYGKLGRGGNEGSKVPKKVDGLTGKPVVKMLCGSQFAIVLTATGHVYTWYELNTVGSHLPEVLVHWLNFLNILMFLLGLWISDVR